MWVRLMQGFCLHSNYLSTTLQLALLSSLKDIKEEVIISPSHERN
jgi:hypothetical protein